MPVQTNAYAVKTAGTPLAPFSFERRDPVGDDVAIDIQFCGVCHSDLHTAYDEWGRTTFPCVPGHEIVGKVTAIGPDVTKFAVGDTVKVTDGPLDGFLGTVEELEPDKDRVRVVVSMFGRETPVDLELDQVEPVKDE